MRSLSKISIAFLCAVITTSCVVQFKAPLPRSLKTRQDPRLIGKWVGQDEQGHRAFVQCTRGPGGETSISFTGENIDTGENSDSSYLGYRNPVFRMVTTTIDHQDYMIMRYADVSNGRGYQIARYTVEGDELTIWLTSVDKVKQAIRNKQLRGDVGLGMLPVVTISDSWPKIAALLKSTKSNDLFVRVGHLESSWKVILSNYLSGDA